MTDFTINLDEDPSEDLGDVTITPTTSAADATDVRADLVDEPTLLAQLKASLSKKVERPEVMIEVPERPGLIIRFSPNITQHQIKAWRKNSGESNKGGMDAVKFASFVLVNTCTGFLLNGQEITHNGDSVGFNDDIIMKMVGATRVVDVVREVFGVEPHIESAALVVLDAAGFNDDLEAVDPTKAS